MAEPTTKDPKQEKQTEQNKTPQVDFDLNLPTNNEKTEEETISLDFSDISTPTSKDNEEIDLNMDTPTEILEKAPEESQKEGEIEKTISEENSKNPANETTSEEQKPEIKALTTEEGLTTNENIDTKENTNQEENKTFNEESTQEIESPTAEVKTVKESEEQASEIISDEINLKLDQPIEEKVNDTQNNTKEETSEQNIKPEDTPEEKVLNTDFSNNTQETNLNIESEQTETPVSTEINSPTKDIAPEVNIELSDTKDLNKEESTSEITKKITTEQTNNETNLNTEVSTPQEESTQDNRLDKEDSLVEEKAEENKEPQQIIEQKELPDVQESTLNMFDETSTKNEPNDDSIPKEEIIPTEIPATEEIQEGPSNNLSQDHKIISQINEDAGKPIEKTQPEAIKEPTNSEVNLDDLLSTPTTETITNNNTINTNQPPAPVAQNTTPEQIPAFTGIHGYQLPPVAEKISQEVKKPGNKKILINFGIGVTIFIVGIFMFKTMYPIEYQNLFSNGENIETTINSELNTTNVAEETTTETGNTIADSDGLFENPTLTNYHGSANQAVEEMSGSIQDDFNAFQDIEETMNNDDTKTKEQLQNYIDQGKKYLVIGKKTNDKDITKYSLFLYKKASTLLLDIENGNQISTDELNSQLLDFETYLQKITGPNDQLLPEPITPTPEDFFGSEDNGTNEEESTVTTETTSPEENTQTQTQGVPGIENTIQ